MKATDEIEIDALYFGVVLNQRSYTSKEQRFNLETYNLFDLSNIRYWAARWVVMTPEERAQRRFLTWCFADVWARCEYEMVACPWPYCEDDTIADSGRKVDLYTLYVEPNAKLLEAMVSRVSESSARAYIKKEKQRFHR